MWINTIWITIESEYSIKESFDFPIILNPFESYSFVFPITYPIISQQEISTENVSKRLSDNSSTVLQSPRLTISAHEVQMAVSQHQSSNQLKTKKKRRHGSKNKSIQYDVPPNINELSKMNEKETTELSELKELKEEQTQTDSITKEITSYANVEIKYKTFEMIDTVSIEMTYELPIPTFNFITIKYLIPEHIYANNFFEITYEIHYNSFKWRHLLMVQNSKEDNEIDCLHPSIDLGVFFKPSIVSVSISYMAGKDGVFELPQIEFRETRSGEVFPITKTCTIVVQNDTQNWKHVFFLFILY